MHLLRICVNFKATKYSIQLFKKKIKTRKPIAMNLFISLIIYPILKTE